MTDNENLERKNNIPLIFVVFTCNTVKSEEKRALRGVIGQERKIPGPRYLCPH